MADDIQLAAGAVGTDIPGETNQQNGELFDTTTLADTYHRFRHVFNYDQLDERQQRNADTTFRKILLEPDFGDLSQVVFDATQNERTRLLDEFQQQQRISGQSAGLGVPESERDNVLEFSFDQARRGFGEGLRGLGRIFDSQSLTSVGQTVVDAAEHSIREGGYQSTYTGSFTDTVSNADGLSGTVSNGVGWVVEKVLENSVSTGATLVGGVASIGLRAAGRLALSRATAATTASGAYVLGTGEVVSELGEQGISLENTDRATLAGAGLAIAALDYISATRGVPALARKSVLRNLINNPSTLRTFGTAAIAEGGTEAAQELISIGASVAEGGQYEVSEVVNRLVDSAIIGGAIGGSFGVASSIGTNTRQAQNDSDIGRAVQEAGDGAPQQPQEETQVQQEEVQTPQQSADVEVLTAATPAVKRGQDPDDIASRIYRGTEQQTGASANRLNGQRISFGPREHVILTGISREQADALQSQVDSGVLPQDAEGFLNRVDNPVQETADAPLDGDSGFTQEELSAVAEQSQSVNVDNANAQAAEAVRTAEEDSTTGHITTENISQLFDRFQGDANAVVDELVDETIQRAGALATNIPITNINPRTLTRDLPGIERTAVKRAVARRLAGVSPGGALSAFEGAQQITNRGSALLTAAGMAGRHEMQALDAAIEGVDVDRATVLSALEGSPEAVSALPSAARVAVSAARAKVDKQTVDIMRNMVSLIAVHQSKINAYRQQVPAGTEQTAETRVQINEEERIVKYLRGRVAALATNRGRYVHLTHEAYLNPTFASQLLREFQIQTGSDTLADSAIAAVTSGQRRTEIQGNLDAARARLASMVSTKNPNLSESEATARANEILGSMLTLAVRSFDGRSANNAGAVNPLEVVFQRNDLLLDENAIQSAGLDALQVRSQIPEEVRTLLGKVEDPAIAYGATILQQRKILANYEMGISLFERAVESGWVSPTPREGFEQVQVQGLSNPFAVFNGVYVPASLKEGLADFTRHGERNAWYERYLALNAWVKMGKITYSTATQARNFFGGAVMSSIASGMSLNHLRAGLDSTSIRRDTFVTDMQVDAAEFGIVGTGFSAGLVNELVQDAGVMFGNSSDLIAGRTGTERLASMHRTATRLYQFGDDFWRVVLWNQYIDVLARSEARKQLGGQADAETFQTTFQNFRRDEAVKQAAADRVTNTYPTYTQIGPNLQSLRRNILIGPFISFPAEILRTSGNLLRNIMSDFRSGDPDLQRLATRQSLAIVGFASTPAILAGALGEDENLDADDLRALNKVALRDYEKNSTMIVTSVEHDPKTGQATPHVVNWSYLNPYAILVDPINAMLRGEDDDTVMDSAGRAALEFVKPFTSPEVLAGTIRDVIANRGGSVYDSEADTVTQVGQIAQYATLDLQPAVAKEIQDVAKAVGGKRNFDGTERRVSEELWQAAGVPIRRVDMNTAMAAKGRKLQRSLSASSTAATRAFSDQTSIITPDLLDAALEKHERTHKAWGEMASIVNDVRETGWMTDLEIVNSLRAGGVSKSNAEALAEGRPAPEAIISVRGLNNRIKRAERLNNPEQAQELQARVDRLMELLGPGVFTK